MIKTCRSRSIRRTFRFEIMLKKSDNFTIILILGAMNNNVPYHYSCPPTSICCLAAHTFRTRLRTLIIYTWTLYKRAVWIDAIQNCPDFQLLIVYPFWVETLWDCHNSANFCSNLIIFLSLEQILYSIQIIHKTCFKNSTQLVSPVIIFTYLLLFIDK